MTAKCAKNVPLLVDPALMIQTGSTQFGKQLPAEVCEVHAIESHVFEVVCISKKKESKIFFFFCCFLVVEARLGKIYYINN